MISIEDISELVLQQKPLRETRKARKGSLPCARFWMHFAFFEISSA